MKDWFFMNILVTGARGMVGQALVANLKNIRDGKNRTRPALKIEEIFEYDIDSAEAFVINIAKFECRNYFGAVKKHSVSTSFSEYTEEQMVEIEKEMSKEQKNLEDVLCNEILAKQIFDDIARDDPVIGRIFYLHFVCERQKKKYDL